MKKMFSLLLVVLMALMALGGCSSDPTDTSVTDSSETSSKDEPVATTENATEEVKEEPGVVKILGDDPALETDLADMVVFQKMEDVLNVKFEWDLVASGSYEEIISTKIAAGGIDADIFKSASITPELLGEGGMIVKLSDYFDTLLPNVKEAINDNIYLESSLTSPDGSIWCLPKFYGTGFNEYPMIRQDWLDQLNIDIPETLDELYTYFTLVKATDLNGNGTNDEIPWCPGTFHYSYVYTCQWYGINPVAIWYWMGLNEKGEVYSYLTSVNFKECMMFLNQCFEENLINNDIANMGQDQFDACMLNDQVGFITSLGSSYLSNWDARIKEAVPNTTAEYVFMSPPNAGYDTTGVRIGGISSTFHYISSMGDNTEDALRVFDYVFGEEGGILTWAGIEGETYNINSDGSYSLGPAISDIDATEATSYLEEIGALNGGYNLPINVSTETYYFSTLLAEGGDRHIDTVNALMSDESISQQAEVSFRFTEEELEFLTEYLNTMRTYAREELAKFYYGARSFDTWDEFAETLDSQYKLSELVDIYATAYARSAR